MFLLKNQMSKWIEKALLGFAAGVMIAASCWSLLIPSIEMAEEQGMIAWIPPAVGFTLGVISLIAVNKLAEKIENKNEQKKAKNGSKFEVEKVLNKELNKSEKIKEKIRSTTMLVVAVTLHNIPEGMAVRSGVCRSTSRKWNNYNRGNSFSCWNSNSKYSRGGYNINASESRRKIKNKVVFIWNVIRNS